MKKKCNDEIIDISKRVIEINSMKILMKWEVIVKRFWNING